MGSYLVTIKVGVVVEAESKEAAEALIAEAGIEIVGDDRSNFSDCVMMDWNVAPEEGEEDDEEVDKLKAAPHIKWQLAALDQMTIRSLTCPRCGVHLHNAYTLNVEKVDEAVSDVWLSCGICGHDPITQHEQLGVANAKRLGKDVPAHAVSYKLRVSADELPPNNNISTDLLTQAVKAWNMCLESLHHK